MNKLIHMSLTLATATLLVNCGGGESGSSTGGTNNSGKGSDKLTITKINDKNFDIVWEKGFDGYSEVRYTAGGSHAVEKLISNNYRGTHTLHCKEDSTSIDERFYTCRGTSVTLDGSTGETTAGVTLLTNLATSFHRRTSLNRDDQGIDYILTYHSSGTLTVE